MALLCGRWIPAFNEFYNFGDDLQLSLDICKGVRPKIVKGTMPEYVELMKRCWSNDPEERPTAKELVMTFYEWSQTYPMELDDEDRANIGNSNFLSFIYF